MANPLRVQPRIVGYAEMFRVFVKAFFNAC
jgi:hypothetical protein